MADETDDITLNLDTNIPEQAEISVKSLKDLKNELKATKNAMAGVEEGSEAFTVAAEKARKLNDKIRDISEGINAQTGEPIERVAGSFGLLGDKIKSLDFKGAAVQLKNVADGVKSIDFKEIIGGIKSFGATMLTLGTELLLNPIFLITAALAAIGVALYKLRDDARESVNEQIKLYDQLGAAIEARYDREIRIAKSAGEKTSELELKKLDATQKRVQSEIKALTYLQDSIVGLNEDQEKMLDGLQKKEQELAADRIVHFNTLKVQAETATTANIAAAQKSKDEIKKLLDQADSDNQKSADKQAADYAASLEKRKASFDELQKFVNGAEAQLETDQAVTAQQKIDLEYIRQTDALQKLLDAAKAKGVAEVDIARQRNEGLAALDAEYALKQKDLDAQIALDKQSTIDAEYEASKVRNQQEIDDNKAIAEQKAADEIAANDKIIEDDKRANAGRLQLASATLGGLLALSDIYFMATNKNLEKGSAKQKAEAKKQFNINKGLSIATATITGIQGVMAAYSSGSAIPVIGAIAGPAFAILAGIAAAANIAKIASAKFDDGGGSGASVTPTTGGGTPNIPEASSPQSLPNFSQFQQNSTGNGTANNTASSGSAQSTPIVKAYVVSQEITDQQTANHYSSTMGQL